MRQKFIYTTLSFLLLAGACTDAARTTGSASNEDFSTDGRAIFKKHCVTCHGIDGKLGLNGAKDLSMSTLKEEEKIIQVTIGKGAMNAFKDLLSEAEIKAVVQFTNNLKTTK